MQVAWADAAAYCQWDGGRLPTEAEFEFAAPGGLDRKRYPWGDDFTPGGKFMANTFQGHFPDAPKAEDGYPATSPVGAFPANGYGLYDRLRYRHGIVERAAGEAVDIFADSLIGIIDQMVPHVFAIALMQRDEVNLARLKNHDNLSV